VWKVLDDSIGKINIIPQEIGRVLLNLYNNAFYAITEKKKKQVEGYEPSVSVSSKKMDGKVEIKVKDNAMGIPQKALDKIFQPFLQQNQPDRVRDLVCPYAMILLRHMKEK
jgi:two-component system NtrC family sensor kinase